MVEFFIQTPLDHTNERRALYSVARLLQEKYGRNSADYVALIANLAPKEVVSWRGLTQIDAILVTEKNIALLDFKNYPDPFDGRNLEGRWPLHQNPRYFVDGGSAFNPYKQAVIAHTRWGTYFSEGSRRVFSAETQGVLQWGHLNGYVLFYPSLHPDTQLAHPANNHLWLSWGSWTQVIEFLFANRPKLALNREEIGRFISELCLAKPWNELEQLLATELGYFVVKHAGQEVRWPIRQWETVTIGRGHDNSYGYQLLQSYNKVSRHHLRLETSQNSVTLFCKGQNGTFINGRRVVEKSFLDDGVPITLGGVAGETGVATLQFHFNDVTPLNSVPATSNY